MRSNVTPFRAKKEEQLEIENIVGALVGIQSIRKSEFLFMRLTCRALHFI